MDEALDHAVELMTAEGVGALSVSEVARRMGIRGPSLYKYFPSRHAIYDALFARGLAGRAGRGGARPSRGCRAGVPRIRAGAAAVGRAGRWSNPALAQLLHWRPVPGFEPSPGGLRARASTTWPTSAPSSPRRCGWASSRPAPTATTSSASTPSSSPGSISQQLANQPGVHLRRGRLQPAHRHRDRPVPRHLHPLRSPPCRRWTATRSAPSSPHRRRPSTPSSPT